MIVLLKILSGRNNYLSYLIKSCLETEEIHKRIELIYAINNLVPLELQIKIPTLVTNNYINQQLYSLEEKLSQAPISTCDNSFSSHWLFLFFDAITSPLWVCCYKNCFLPERLSSIVYMERFIYPRQSNV